MSVQAGETTETTPSQVVDASALAREIVQNVMATLPVHNQQQPEPRAPRKSELQAGIDEYQASGKIDEVTGPIMFDLVKRAAADIKHEQEEALKQSHVATSTRQIHDELGRMVERYAASSADPDLIRELKMSISQRAIDEYNANPALRNKYAQNGSVDWTEMDKLVVKQVTRWNKKAADGGESKPAGGPAMKNSAPAGAIETSRELDRDSLNERQSEVFNSQVGFGVKNMNLSRADAEKRALDLINKAESKSRSSKK